MTLAHLVLGILLATLTALPTSAEELSLRERVERARAAARERAREELAEGEEGGDVPDDPAEHPDLFEIHLFRVPSHGDPRNKALPNTPGTESIFYARVDRDRVGTDFSLGSTVFFYLHEDGRLQLSGHGEIVKIQRRRSVVEARIDACRFTYPYVRRYRRREYHQVRLAADKDPKKVDWYLSAKLIGPEVEGWDPETIRRFALGQPWMGMPHSVLEAMMGLPEERIEAAGVVSLVYGEGKDAMRYDITDGVVTGRVPVNQF